MIYKQASQRRHLSTCAIMQVSVNSEYAASLPIQSTANSSPVNSSLNCGVLSVTRPHPPLIRDIPPIPALDVDIPFNLPCLLSAHAWHHPNLCHVFNNYYCLFQQPIYICPSISHIQLAYIISHVVLKLFSVSASLSSKISTSLITDICHPDALLNSYYYSKKGRRRQVAASTVPQRTESDCASPQADTKRSRYLVIHPSSSTSQGKTRTR